jgi:rhodanese-related sulfurtransferase
LTFFFLDRSKNLDLSLSQEVPMTITTISPRDLEAKRQAGQAIELIDVRTPIEYQEIHCPFARNVPLSDLDPARVMHSRTRPSEEPLFVICRSGSRGKQACEKFHAAGFTNVINVEGGTLAWEQCGLQVQRGRKMISLERQVRIAAGLMVLVGAVLGFLVHPGFLGIAAFVGAGLIFAGVTDTCGMGLMLARMPWNRVAAVMLLLAWPARCRCKRRWPTTRRCCWMSANKASGTPGTWKARNCCR